MTLGSGINLALQLLFAACRYALTALVYARVTLGDVGHISAVLAYVTAITFVAGLELHHIANRPLILSTSSTVRIGADRIFSALALIVMAVLFSTVWLPAQANPSYFLFCLFAAIAAEYLSLELTRIQIAQKRFLIATCCGFLRTISPFVGALFQSPTIEAMLLSWFAGSMLSSLIQIALILKRSDLSIDWSRFPRHEYRAAGYLFVSGAIMALLPTTERFLISKLYSVEALGQYSLTIILVSATELLITGAIWQPLMVPITRRLAAPETRGRTVALVMLALSSIYFVAATAAIAYGAVIFALLRKPVPSTALMCGVFMIGFGKSLYTLVFYGAYANHNEKHLPLLQIGMLLLLGSAFVVGANAGWGIGEAAITVGSLWIALLLCRLVALGRRKQDHAPDAASSATPAARAI